MNNRKCWICREESATTGEHKFPLSYLKRIPDEWSNISHARWDGDSFRVPTQGPKSNNLKLKVLCADCNNSRTQPQDSAFSAFIEYIKANEAKVWDSKAFDISIFDTLNLYRALLKMEFSRLYDDGISILPEISDFVGGGDDWEVVSNHVRIDFRFTQCAKDYGLVYPFDSNAPYYKEPYFISHQINFGWLAIHFLYAPADRPDLPWPEWNFGHVVLSAGNLDSSFYPAL